VAPAAPFPAKVSMEGKGGVDKQTSRPSHVRALPELLRSAQRIKAHTK